MKMNDSYLLFALRERRYNKYNEIKLKTNEINTNRGVTIHKHDLTMITTISRITKIEYMAKIRFENVIKYIEIVNLDSIIMSSRCNVFNTHKCLQHMPTKSPKQTRVSNVPRSMNGNVYFNFSKNSKLNYNVPEQY